MSKTLILIISVFALSTSHGQSTMTVQEVDSIAATIETNILLEKFVRVDSASISTQTQKAIIYAYIKQKGTGQVEKIERIGNGTCDSKEQYYFVNGKLVKAVISMICDSKVTWDSELYYYNDTVFAQSDRGTTLYGPAFMQTAYNDWKRISQLETNKQ